MGKQDTVAKYIDAFLKGKSPAMVEKFRSKDVDRQYASIMQWRRKMRILQNTPQSVRDITDLLRKASENLVNAPLFSAADIEEITNEINRFKGALEECIESQRLRKIRELETQQEAIRRELEELRTISE